MTGLFVRGLHGHGFVVALGRWRIFVRILPAACHCRRCVSDTASSEVNVHATFCMKTGLSC